VSTLDLFDGRLTLLTGAQGTAWRQAAAGLDGAGAPVAVLSPGRELADSDGLFVQRYGVGDSGAVLVRPDGYVAWRAGMATADAAPALRDAVSWALGRPDMDAEHGIFTG
jgi:putative polyketide hydroxylase